MKENDASSTAYTVIQGLLLTARKPEFRHLIAEDTEEIGTRILSSSKEGQKRLRQIDGKWGQTLLAGMEQLMLPNITLHYALRKAYIERKIREALTEGVTQVINIGAGFDTLLYRLARQYPELNCIEVDHPATQKIKREALTQPALKLSNLHFLSVDFTHQPLDDELGSFTPFDPFQHTLCLLEGVLMYLDSDQIYTLLDSLENLLHFPQRHLIFSAVEPEEAHPESFGPLLKIYLSFKKEPLQWFCMEEDIPYFIDKSDFKLVETANGEHFRELFLPQYEGAVHRGEYIAYAINRKKRDPRDDYYQRDDFY